MTDPSKIKPSHTQRAACIYIRQSTPGQVEHNRESTARESRIISAVSATSRRGAESQKRMVSGSPNAACRGSRQGRKGWPWRSG